MAVHVFRRFFSAVVELGHDPPSRLMDPSGSLVEQPQIGLFIQYCLALVGALLPVHAHMAGNDQAHFVLCQLHQSIHPGGGQLAVGLGQVLVGG